MKKISIYEELKNLYSTKIENLLENHKVIGQNYSILGFGSNKVFILNHHNGAMYLVEDARKISRLDFNTDEFEKKYKKVVRNFVNAIIENNQNLINLRKKELNEVLNESLYFFSLPCDGFVPISESIRKKVFNYLIENELFKEYLIRLGEKIKNNQTILIESIPFIGLRARDKLIKFFREQIDLTYDQARTLTVAILNLAFKGQFREALSINKLIDELGKVLPAYKARKLGFLIVEAFGRAMLNEFKVTPSTNEKGIPLDNVKEGDIIEIEEKEDNVFDENGHFLKPGKYKVSKVEKGKGSTLVNNKNERFEKVKIRQNLNEAKTLLIETTEPEELVQEELNDIEEEKVQPEDNDLEKALNILKKVFKNEVNELSDSANETFSEKEKSFKNLMNSITSLEKYLEEIKEETELPPEEEIQNTDEEFNEETEKDISNKFKDIEDLIDEEEESEEKPKEKQDIDIEDLIDKENENIEQKNKKESKEKQDIDIEDLVDSENEENEEELESEDLPSKNKNNNEEEAPEYKSLDETIKSLEENSNMDTAPEYPSEEDEEKGKQDENTAPEFPEIPKEEIEGIYNSVEEEEKSNNENLENNLNDNKPQITLGDIFIFEKDNTIKDINNNNLIPEELYTVISIDQEKNEVVLSNESGQKTVVSMEDLSQFDNYFSPVKSLTEGTVLEVVDESIVDINEQNLPLGKYELIMIDENANTAKISDTKTKKLYTVDLNTLGNMKLINSNNEKENDEEFNQDKEKEEEFPVLPEVTDDENVSDNETEDNIETNSDNDSIVASKEKSESNDDKIEITVKIPPEQIDNSKIEDLLFGLTKFQKNDYTVKTDSEKDVTNSSLPKNLNTNNNEEFFKNIPTQILNTNDEEVINLYKELVDLEQQIKEEIENNKEVYQIENEMGKYTTIIDNMKNQLLNPSDTIKQDIKNFLSFLKNEDEEEKEIEPNNDYNKE